MFLAASLSVGDQRAISSERRYRSRASKDVPDCSYFRVALSIAGNFSSSDISRATPSPPDAAKGAHRFGVK